MSLLTYPALPGLTYQNKCTLVWSTLKQPATSGRETRIGLWSYPARRYELAYEFLRNSGTTQEWQTLVGFFNQVGGAAGAFLYNDPNDNSATAQTFGVGNGSATTFQLARSFGGFTEPIFAPISPTVFINGGATTAFTLGSSGQVTFTTAPASGAVLTWTGTFNWLCRFDGDTLETDQVMSTYWEAKKVSFSTVKL